MRKKRTLFGHYISALILFIITSVIVHSCKKDNRFNSKELPVTAVLKQWFETNKISYSRFDGMEPLWETMYVNSQDEDKTVYELQLSNPKNIYQKIEGSEKDQMRSDKNFRLLIFKKNGSTEVAYGCYMSIIGNAPEKENLSNIHYKQAGSFSGKIVFFEMNGTLANGWEYSKGSATQRISGIEPGFSKDIKLMSLPGFRTTIPDINNHKVMVPPPLACPIYSPVYGSTCVGVDGYMECTPYIAYYVCADPDNPVVGEYDGYGATHGGGYAGGGGSTNYLAPRIIVDPQTRTCIATIVNNIVSQAKLTGAMTAVIGAANYGDPNKTQSAISFLAGLNTQDIRIKEDEIPDKEITDASGQVFTTRTNGSTSPSRLEITLNTLMLNEATDLAVAATTIHELMHAYLTYGISRVTDEEQKIIFQDLNQLIYDRDGSAITDLDRLEPAQHTQMATTYVTSMAKLLEDFAKIKGITESPDKSITLNQYCQDLFWGNLQKTTKVKYQRPARSESNAAREYKNKSNSTNKKNC
ncbi:hypothetical protein [Pedobacter sp. KBS0701]|uniref:hypothetical protein n=1 Tax=unclassified Pedobacter TaxID=2628915 RepID=UPI00110D7F80|nr:hypothetical protein [Pedobacter sp. KBS0701]QDW24169.1 hypothetical protein FFJ24_004755 [Pedobacter sp. KBS0701]